MHNNEPGTPVDSSLGYTFQNDFLALTQAFSLPEIPFASVNSFIISRFNSPYASSIFKLFSLILCLTYVPLYNSTIIQTSLIRCILTVVIFFILLVIGIQYFILIKLKSICNLCTIIRTLLKIIQIKIMH